MNEDFKKRIKKVGIIEVPGYEKKGKVTANSDCSYIGDPLQPPS